MIEPGDKIIAEYEAVNPNKVVEKEWVVKKLSADVVKVVDETKIGTRLITINLRTGDIRSKYPPEMNTGRTNRRPERQLGYLRGLAPAQQ